jgi:hypothetical protein
MGERVGLARSRTGDDEQRRADVTVRGHAVLDRTPLVRIERVQI